MLSYCAILNHTNQWFIIHTYETQQEQQYQHQTHNGNARFMCMVQFRRWKGDRMRARERARTKARTRCENSSVIVFPFSFILFVAVCLLAVIFPPFHRGFCLTKNSISVLHVLWKYWWCWCDCRSTIGNSSMQFDYIFDGKRRSKWHKRNQHSSWKCVLSKIDSAFLWDSSHSQSSFRRLRGRSILFLKF